MLGQRARKNRTVRFRLASVSSVWLLSGNNNGIRRTNGTGFRYFRLSWSRLANLEFRCSEMLVKNSSSCSVYDTIMTHYIVYIIQVTRFINYPSNKDAVENISSGNCKSLPRYIYIGNHQDSYKWHFYAGICALKRAFTLIVGDNYQAILSFLKFDFWPRCVWKRWLLKIHYCDSELMERVALISDVSLPIYQRELNSFICRGATRVTDL